MVKDILISVTDKCNLSCSFCSATEEMEKRSVGLGKVKERLTMAYNNGLEVGMVTWSGGEPLLVPKRLSELMDFVETLWPNATHRLVTNGVYLTQQPLSFLQRFKIIMVAIDGYRKSERPLHSFLVAKDYIFFEYIKALEGIISFRQVVTRKQLLFPDWFEDISLLHQALSKLGMYDLKTKITLDSYLTEPLTTPEVDNFIYGFRALNETAPIGVQVILDRFFDSYHCDCGDGFVITHSAGQHVPPAVDAEITVGCALLAASIGSRNYKRILTSFPRS